MICLTLAMNLLFVISITCFFALFVTALSIARHVRSQELRLQQTEQRSKAAFVPHRPDRQDLVLPRTAAQTPDRLLRCKEPDWRFLVSHLGRRRFVPTPAATRGDRTSHKALPLGLLQERLGDLSDPYQTFASQPATGLRRR